MKTRRSRLCASIAVLALALPLAVTSAAVADTPAADSNPSTSESPPEGSEPSGEQSSPAGEDVQLEVPEADAQLYVVPPIPMAVPAAEYWTEERMENATPLDAIEITDEELAEILEDTVGVEQPVSAGLGSSANSLPALSPLAAAAYQHAPIMHVGKVFFSKNGGNYVCSGASIQSSHGNLVSTAGHCIHSDGQFVSNFTFVPAYSNGNAPYGHWQAATYTTTSQWANSRSFAYDVGFVRVHNLNGRTLHQTVGSRPGAWSTGNDQWTSGYGYPAGSPFNGQNLIACHANRTAHQSGIIRLGDCPFNGGASGGPWYNGGNANGSQVSVNSFITGDGAIYGPYFGTGIKPVYDQAAGYSGGGGGGGGNSGLPTGTSHIKVNGRNLCVDIPWANPANGTQVQIVNCSGNPAQSWTRHSDGSIRALGACLDVRAAGTANGTAVQTYQCNGTAAQKWVYDSANQALRNPNSGKCLDVPSSQFNDGQKLQIWTCNNTGAQKWTF